MGLSFGEQGYVRVAIYNHAFMVQKKIGVKLIHSVPSKSKDALEGTLWHSSKTNRPGLEKYRFMVAVNKAKK